MFLCLGWYRSDSISYSLQLIEINWPFVLKNSEPFVFGKTLKDGQAYSFQQRFVVIFWSVSLLLIGPRSMSEGCWNYKTHKMTRRAQRKLLCFVPHQKAEVPLSSSRGAALMNRSMNEGVLLWSSLQRQQTEKPLVLSSLQPQSTKESVSHCNCRLGFTSLPGVLYQLVGWKWIFPSYIWTDTPACDVSRLGVDFERACND